MQALFRAVILQAIQDAKSRSGKQEMVFWRNQAHHWLFTDRKDFTFICDLAGFHPDHVRRKINAAQERGFFWKNAPLQAVKQKPAPKKRGRKPMEKQMRLPLRVHVCSAPPKPPRARRMGAISSYVQLHLGF